MKISNKLYLIGFALILAISIGNLIENAMFNKGKYPKFYVTDVDKKYSESLLVSLRKECNSSFLVKKYKDYRLLRCGYIFPFIKVYKVHN